MKESKHAYYNEYFETNWNNSKTTWKGINQIAYFSQNCSFQGTECALP